jgi:serine/threonine protein kinase
MVDNVIHKSCSEMCDSVPGAESFTGTLAYMSPARIRAVASYSFEADMWSLGITLITIISGKLPFPTNLGSWQLMNAILNEGQNIFTLYLLIYMYIFTISFFKYMYIFTISLKNKFFLYEVIKDIFILKCMHTHRATNPTLGKHITRIG